MSLPQPQACHTPAAAHDYPFLTPGAGTDPWVYLEQLLNWSDNGTVLRFIVSGTPVNAAVILDPIRYGEDDGTNNITCVIPLRGYRELTAEETDSTTGNAARAVETEPTTPSSYVVQAGDTLSGICRRFYGDSSLYGKLAAYNGVKNVSLIFTGQVILLPAAATLAAAKATVTNTGKVTKTTSDSSASTNTTTEDVKVTLTFTGNPAYFGRGSISYTAQSGRTGKTTVSDSGFVLVPKRSSVTIRWEARNGHSSNYRIIDGNTINHTAAKPDPMVSFPCPIKDFLLVVNWVE